MENGRAMASALEDVSDVFTHEGSPLPQTASTTTTTSGPGVFRAALGTAPEQLHHVACLTSADGQPHPVAQFDLETLGLASLHRLHVGQVDPGRPVDAHERTSA